MSPETTSRTKSRRRRPARASLGHRLLSGLRATFTENLGLKVFCLCSALLVVAYQRSQGDEKARTIAFALNAQLPEKETQRELMTPLPPHVKVTVQGSTRALEELAASAPALELDLRSGQQQHVEFDDNSFGLPPGVTVRLIDPPNLRLEWESIITRQVPVQSSVTGRVADGHEVAKQSVEPERVSLRGPASLVRVTQLARVAPFDITGLSTGVYRRQLALDPAPSRTQYVEISSVTVTVEIRRRQITASFPRQTVEIVGIPGAKVVPAKVDVTVRGPPDVVKALQPELVIPRVDATAVDTLKHGSAVLPVSVDLTRATAEIQPPTVKLSW